MSARGTPPRGVRGGSGKTAFSGFIVPLLPSLRAAGLFLAVLLPRAVHAERLFVGILETDSYQSVIYGASAFSRLADLPLALEWVQGTLDRAICLPSFAGADRGRTLRIVQTVETQTPVGAGNPANVAIIPLTDDGRTVLETLAAAYRKQTRIESLTRFESPVSTNHTPVVTVAVAKRHLFTSPSAEAVLWAWENRSLLLDAPPQSIPGTLRFLVNPQRLADLTGLRSEKTEAFGNTDRFLRDCETFSFALTLDSQALTLTVRGKPAAGTGLARLAAAMRPPRATLWNGLPEHAFFASLSACDAPHLWDPYLGPQRLSLLRPGSGLAPTNGFSGDCLVALSPTRDQRGICLVRIEPVVRAADAEKAIRSLHTVTHTDGITLKPLPARRTATGVEVVSYDLAFHAPDAVGNGKADLSVLNTLLALFLKQAVLETAVTEGFAITTVGPVQTLDRELPDLAFPERQLTLERRLRMRDPALADEPLTTGANLRLASLLRHLVSIIPNVKPEHLRLLPTGGDGAAFGLARGADGSFTASLRFGTTEWAALQRINRDGRAVLQELFFQMFARQMMEMRQAPADPAPRAPGPAP